MDETTEFIKEARHSAELALRARVSAVGFRAKDLAKELIEACNRLEQALKDKGE